MNWKLPALLVAAAAVVALILWSWSSNEPSTVPQKGPELASLAPPAAGAAVQAEGLRGETAAPGARQEVAAPADASAPAPETVVRGRLVTLQGAPLSGITVELQSFRGDERFGITVPVGQGRNAGVRRPSDQDGRFEFKVAADRGGWISIDDERHVLQKEAMVGFQPSRAPIDLGELTVMVAATLAGVVQDEQGHPLAGIKVGAYLGDGLLPGGGESSTTSKDDGTFLVGKVRPGKVTLRTAGPGWLPGVLSLEVKDAEQQRGLVLSLHPGRAISGRVTDDRGVALPRVKVGAMRQEQRPGMSVERFTPEEATETDANGWFTLAGLAGDSANVRAWGPGHASANEAGVAVGTSNLVLTLQRLGGVRGVLRDRAGKPIAGSRVSASLPRGMRDGFGAALLDGLEFDLPDGRGAATTAEDGSFLVENVPPGAVTVRAQGRGHRPVEQRGVNVQPGATTPDVALVADLGATLRATVVDGSDHPVAGVKVKVAPPAQDAGNGSVRMRAVTVGHGDGPVAFDPMGQGTLGEGTTGDDGTAEIHGLPAGAAVVEASHAQLAEPRPQTIELPPAGTVECRLALRKGGFAEVQVVDQDHAPLAGARFEVKGPLGAESRDRAATADASGKARVGPLPAGSYEAQLIQDPEAQSMGGGMVFRTDGERKLAQSRVHFAIGEGSDVAVELVRPLLARVFGIVSDATGPAAGVEVEAEPVREGDGDQGPPEARNAHSDASGRYEIANLEPGRYLLRYGRPGQSAKASEEVQIASTAEVERNLRLRYGKLRVAVRNKADGEPVEGAEVSLLRGGGSQGQPARERRMVMVTMSVNTDGAGESTTMTMGDTRVKTDVDGVAEIADVPAGTWLVRVRDDKHVQVDLPDQNVVEGALQDCGVVQMDQAGRVRGRVLDKDGGQVPMAMVMYRRADGGESNREPAMGGSFNLRGLRPGKWLLKAQALMMGPGEAPWGPEVEVEVQAGKTQGTDLSLGAG